jgi:uncharacterized protein (DUF433 family)
MGLARQRIIRGDSTMEDKNWIISDSAHLGGKARVRGTRISVAFLLECLADGMSVEEIVDAYPTLAEEAVRGVLQELAHEKEAVVT